MLQIKLTLTGYLWYFIRLIVETVKKISLEMVIGQQVKEEGHDENYLRFLNLTFHSFAT